MIDFSSTVKKLQQVYKDKPPKDKKEAEQMAQSAADECLKYLNGIPVPLGTALRKLGFKVWVKEFSNPAVSGIMALNASKDYPKVIGVNSHDNHGHQAFTLAHEFAHYIFDMENLDKEWVIAHYNTDNDNENDLREYRANKFAAYLLMPEDVFRYVVKKPINQLKDKDELIRHLARIFDVSTTAVSRRMEELDIVYYENLYVCL